MKQASSLAIAVVATFLAIYTILPSFFKAKVQFNYITWFIILYFIASYIRKYPNKYFENKKLWCYLSIASLAI